ncbi:hypothetical protein P856_689 [Candidatus Endolissoclinum faulkneri L5]|uniref:DUF2066 domain-containing protein n=1 Tax=Candidatus Endolissoclinum faulkneri L5 TaxID=1401328 RepID=V9TTG9_9PROT|nr:DUF2066 domain-containing protein [Candidatus Endolissoclinum faulkneri]AHC73896.1 hypothetical protein P856_689 [Candidatus Endolissoclinum faulkneri L5]
MYYKSFLIVFFTPLLITLYINWASAEEIYTVRDIPVEAFADNPSAAKAKAIANGRHIAFERMINRLVPLNSAKALEEQSDQTLDNLIIGFEVANENSTSMRYIANISFTFDPVLLRNFLVHNNLSFAETSSAPVLIIPVLDNDNGPVLWEESNVFRKAWAKALLDVGLVPIIIPRSSISDINDLSTDDAMGGNLEALTNFARTYGARDTIIVVAKPSNNSIDLFIRRIGLFGSSNTMKKNILVDDSEYNYDALVQYAIGMIQESWKSENLIQGKLESQITAIVPIDSMRHWVAIRKVLDNIIVLLKYDVVQLSKKNALINLRIRGTVKQLGIALEQKNLRIISVDDKYIIVQTYL